MGTYNPKYSCSYNLLRGLACAVRIGVISTHEPASRVSRIGSRLRVCELSTGVCH